MVDDPADPARDSPGPAQLWGMPDSVMSLPSDSKAEQLPSAVSTHEEMTQNNVSTVVGL